MPCVAAAARHMFADLQAAPPPVAAHPPGLVGLCVDAAVLLANLLPLAAGSRKGERRALDEILVTLSLTAILLVLVPGPFAVLEYTNNHWVGGVTTCQFYHVTSTWFQLALLGLVTLACVERWSALRHALQFVNTGQRSTRVGIVTVYVTALLIALLPLFHLAPPQQQIQQLQQQSYQPQQLHQQLQQQLQTSKQSQHLPQKLQQLQQQPHQLQQQQSQELQQQVQQQRPQQPQQQQQLQLQPRQQSPQQSPQQLQHQTPQLQHQRQQQQSQTPPPPPPPPLPHFTCVSWLVAPPATAQEHVFAFALLVAGCGCVVTATMLAGSQLLVLLGQPRHVMSPHDRQLSVLVLVLTGLSHAAWIPTLVLVTLHQMGVAVPPAALPHALLAVKGSMALLPALCAACSGLYRHAYAALLRSLCRRRPRRRHKEDKMKKVATSAANSREETPCCSTSATPTSVTATSGSDSPVTALLSPDPTPDHAPDLTLDPSHVPCHASRHTSATVAASHQQTTAAGSCLSLISEEDEEEEEEEEVGTSEDDDEEEEEGDEGMTSDTEGGEESDDGVGQRQIVTYHTVVDESCI